MKPVEIEFLIKNGTKATLEQITADLNQVGREGSDSVGATSTAFENAQRQALIMCNIMEQLEGKIKELQSTPADLDQTENIAQIEALQKKVEELKLHIKQLEEVSEDTQIVPPSMPMAKRQFDGLHFSIQQMAREMPTLAMGPQMFFLAISNNLPIFTDELARARREYDALVAAGQKGTPVWKQVVRSLLSWQTAMVTGIMLLVMYGKEITQSISDMIGWEKAKKEMSEVTKDAQKEIEKEISTITMLQRVLSNSEVSYQKRISALNELKSIVPGYNVSLTKEGDLIDNNTSAIERYLEAFREKIYLQAAEQDLVEAYTNKRKAELEVEEKIAKGKIVYAGGSMSAGNMTYTTNSYSEKEAKKMREDYLKSYDEDIDKLNQEISDRSKKIESEEKNSPLYGQIYENAKKAWIDAKKGLSAIEADRNKFTLKQYEDSVNLEKETRDKFSKFGGNINGQDPNAKKAAQTQKAYENERLKSIKDAKEAELDLERSAIQDKIKLIEFERDTRIKAIQEEKEAYMNKYGKNADTSGFDREITVVGKQADADIGEQNKEDIKARLVAMQEYLKEYGTFQQKKYAVAEEYARKIQDAQTEGERLTLEKELTSFNSNLTTQDLKMNIDWVAVFGEFGGMFSEMIKPALEDAKKLLNTDDFKNADDASKQALVEAISQMEAAVGGSGTLNFKQLGVDMRAYQNSLIALDGVRHEEIEAINLLREAQRAYELALKSGTEAEITTAQTNLSNAQINADAAAENVQSQTDTTNNFRQQVSETASSLKGGMENITSNINKLVSGSFAGAYEGIVGLMKSLGGADTALGKLAEKLDIPIISWILALLDALKDGLSDLIGGILDGIFNAISGIISDILSGDLFITIGESILKGVVSIVKSIVTLGGLLNFWGGESDPELQADIDRLTASNERLENALNRLADKMDEAPVSKATEIYQEQLDNIDEMARNMREMMQREAGAWTNSGYGFFGLGGESSSNRYIDENISDSEWERISNIVGRKIKASGDFWNLSPEEMAEVAEKAGGIYDKIKEYADDGHRDAAKYMDDYIAYAKEREELEKAYYEKLTNTPFDSVRDEFKNTLMDMESDAEDFANDFEKMLQNAIIESLMTEKYDKALKDWYRAFGDAMEDGEMTQGEKDMLKNDYNNIVNDALKDRDALKDIFGWEGDSTTTSQKGRSGSFETMSQDQGNKLEGLFTANEMLTARIEETVERVDVQMSIAVGHLEKIEENTGDCAEYLEAIKDDIRQMIRDGLKVK